MWLHYSLTICVANKSLKLLLESSGNSLNTTGGETCSTHIFTYIALRLAQQVCWAACFSVSQQNANAGKLMYFKTQVDRNGQLRSLCNGTVASGSSWQLRDEPTRCDVLFQTAWIVDCSVCVNSVRWTSRASLTHTVSYFSANILKKTAKEFVVSFGANITLHAFLSPLCRSCFIIYLSTLISINYTHLAPAVLLPMLHIWPKYTRENKGRKKRSTFCCSKVQ